MHYLPAFIAPTRYRDAAAALAQVKAIYAQQVLHLRQAMQHYVSGAEHECRIRRYVFQSLHDLRYPIEVTANADVIHAGDFAHVVDLISHL